MSTSLFLTISYGYFTGFDMNVLTRERGRYGRAGSRREESVLGRRSRPFMSNPGPPWIAEWHVTGLEIKNPLSDPRRYICILIISPLQYPIREVSLGPDLNCDVSSEVPSLSCDLSPMTNTLTFFEQHSDRQPLISWMITILTSVWS